METKFFYCKHCGKVITIVVSAGTQTICCGEPMTELIVNTSDGATEKHIPIVTIIGDTVEVVVGSVVHPMLPEHFIEWIYLATQNGGQLKKLIPGDQPQASFVVKNDKPFAVFAYCNLHGLWKANI